MKPLENKGNREIPGETKENRASRATFDHNRLRPLKNPKQSLPQYAKNGGRSDAATNALALALTLTARAVPRVPPSASQRPQGEGEAKPAPVPFGLTSAASN